MGMMADLYEWGRQWGVSLAALHDLEQRMGSRIAGTPDHDATGSEANVQARVRLEAAQKGVILWRNNVGACTDEHGNHIRYGLANDSKKVNEVMKSSDLIGIRTVLVTPDMVGCKIGQFVAREVKKPDWYYQGTAREKAQQTFIEAVLARGGDAAFANGEGSL